MNLQYIHGKRSHSPQALAWGCECETNQRTVLTVYCRVQDAEREHDKPLKRFTGVRCRNPKLKLGVNEKSFEFTDVK